jgi:hypothetical protein
VNAPRAIKGTHEILPHEMPQWHRFSAQRTSSSLEEVRDADLMAYLTDKLKSKEKSNG